MSKGPLIFAVNKPVDKTTFYLIKKAKPHLGKVNGKIGHFGTLDPFAEGLVLLGARGAMRLMNYVHKNTKKSYEATGLIGTKTDSGDLTGNIVAQNSKTELEEKLPLLTAQIQTIMDEMKGKYQQKPPAFSATKFEGKALYEYARAGIHIDKEAVERDIFELEFMAINELNMSFKCSVGTGTYVRTLFEDLCSKFGLFGHLTNLKRTQIGEILLENAMDLEELNLPLIESKAIAINEILRIPELTLSDVDSCSFLHGRQIHLKNLHIQSTAEQLLLVHSSERCLGLMDNLGNPKLVFGQEF